MNASYGIVPWYPHVNSPPGSCEVNADPQPQLQVPINSQQPKQNIIYYIHVLGGECASSTVPFILHYYLDLCNLSKLYLPGEYNDS